MPLLKASWLAHGHQRCVRGRTWIWIWRSADLSFYLCLRTYVPMCIPSMSGEGLWADTNYITIACHVTSGIMILAPPVQVIMRKMLCKINVSYCYYQVTKLYGEGQDTPSLHLSQHLAYVTICRYLIFLERVHKCCPLNITIFTTCWQASETQQNKV